MVTISREGVSLSSPVSLRASAADFFLFLAHPATKSNGIFLPKEAAESYNEEVGQCQPETGGKDGLKEKEVLLDFPMPPSSFSFVQ
jgi:hypothetical protein